MGRVVSDHEARDCPRPSVSQRLTHLSGAVFGVQLAPLIIVNRPGLGDQLSGSNVYGVAAVNVCA